MKSSKKKKTAELSTDLRRFGVSMEDELLERFDQLIERKGYATRSEALRDLVRSALADELLADANAEAVATVSLVYNHHVPRLSARLTHYQHQALDLINSTVHIHLDEAHCLEVLIVRGPYGRVRELADNLISVKGVKHGRFMATTAQVAGARSDTHSHAHPSHPSTSHKHA